MHCGRAGAVAYAVLGLVVATSAASLAAFYTVPRYPDDDYRPLIAHTVEQGSPEDTIFAVYPWQVGYWRSYGSPAGPTAVLTPDTAWGPAVAGALDAALARGRVWFPAHLALGAMLETQIESHLAGPPCLSSTNGTGRTPASAHGRTRPRIHEFYGRGSRGRPASPIHPPGGQTLALRGSRDRPPRRRPPTG